MPTARSTPTPWYSKPAGATQRVPNKAARVMDGLRRPLPTASGGTRRTTAEVRRSRPTPNWRLQGDPALGVGNEW
jgi:hypothetical protein